MTVVIVSLPGEGPGEVRLSEDLENRDIKAGGDEFQNTPVKKYSLFSVMAVGGEDGAIVPC